MLRRHGAVYRCVMNRLGHYSRTVAGGLGLTLATLLLSLLCLEGALRWLPGILPRQLRAVNDRMETAVRWDETVRGDADLGYVVRPGVFRTVRLDGVAAEFRTVQLLHEGVGFRDMELPMAGARVDVAIGDSFTVCYGVPAGDCWVNLLSRKTARPIANLGVSGYSAVAASQLLRRYGGAFQPKVVLHGVFLNDFDENLQFDAWKQSGRANLRRWYHEQNLGRLGYWLFRQFRAYRVFWSLMRARRSRTYHVSENGLNLYLSPTGWWRHATVRATHDDRFQAMKRVLLDEQRTAAAMGARLVVLLFPFKEQVYWDYLVAGYPALASIEIDRPFEELGRFCEEQAIPYVDLTQALRSRAGEQLYFSMDAHWNPRGNDVVATEVFRSLREQDIL